MSIIAKIIKSVKPSPTLAVSAKALELKSQGIDIISLSAGEPDFDTPSNIKEAAIKAILAGKTKYTPADGTKDLKKAIANKFKKENNIEFNLNEIIVSTGAKQVIYNLFMATIDPGDEVIIPSPYWVSYPDMVMLAGGVPVIVKTNNEDGFQININEIEKAITPKTKWLIINSPSNPTGAVLTKDILEQLADLMKRHKHLHVMSDDIYEHIIYDNTKFYTLRELAPDLKDRIFTVNGVSKGYSMTGWRIGYGAGNSEIVKAMSILQSQSTSNPCSISQEAAREALEGDQSYIKVNTENFAKKRDLVLEFVSKINGISSNRAEGAFYLFLECSELFGKKTSTGQIIKDSNDFAAYLLEQANIAVVPGIAFGVDGYIRISYATSFELLEKAMQRLSNAVSELN